MAALDREIEMYEKRRAELEERCLGKWVVFYDQELTGPFDTFEGAAEEAVRLFGRGPYLIRRVGAPPITLPASVMFRSANAPN